MPGPYNSVFTGPDIDRLLAEINSTAERPAWQTIPTQNWETGDIINFSLSDYVISPDGSALTFSLISGALPTTLTVDSAGDITGTIDADQGGTYDTVFSATNDSGTATQALPAIVVSLAFTAPTWKASPDNVPDFNLQEVGGSFSLDLNDYILDDGDPTKVATLSYSYVSDNGFPTGLTFNLDGTITGITTAEQTITTILVTVSNEQELTSTESFQITVLALQPASETPLIAGWYSGELACAASGVAPTWLSPVNFSFAEGETVAIDLNDYIASEGTAAITGFDYAVSSDTVPAGLTFDKTGAGAGLGFITGDADAATTGVYSLNFTATNGDVSDDSGVFSMEIYLASTVFPTLDSIEAFAGTSAVYFNFSEAVVSSTGVLGFTDGIVFTVNGTTRTLTYVSGTGTTRINYHVTGVVFSEFNSLQAVLTNSACNIESDATGNDVVDADVSFAIPSIPTGVIMSDSFESGNLLSPVGGSWGNGKNVTVSTVVSRTGSFSLRFNYRTFNAAELTYDLLGNYPEIWMKWWIYYPDGTEGDGPAYCHRDSPPSNNKLLRLRAINPGDSTWSASVGASTWPSTNTSCLSGVGLERSEYDINSCRVLTASNGPIGGKFDIPTLGVWHEVKFHYKVNSASNDDGVAQLYINGVLRSSFTNLALGLNLACNAGWRSGYIMGAANSGWDAETNIYVDDFVVSTDPL